MSGEIDPIDFGRLTQAVETLTTTVEKLTAKVEELEGRMTFGKGVLAGLLMLAGGTGAGALEVIHRLSH